MTHSDRDDAQRERATQAWALVVTTVPDPAGLEALRRILRSKRFERAALLASLPGTVRRGARVDLEPIRAALEQAGIACSLQRREADGAGGRVGADTEDPMNESERIVRDFIQAWSRLDPKELAGYFAEDGIYHNMPTGPVQGRDNIEQLIRGFAGPWTETVWEIRRILSAGDLVMVERVDRTRAGEKACDLPCTGVFEMENGQIKAWRDYFDLGTYQRGLG